MNCKNKSFMTKKRAFTLIELLIVIAIIGILFIVLVSKVDFATDKAKTSGVQTDFRSFQMAFETVAKENAGFNTFGWDTGDANQDGIRNSYDEGDNGVGGGIAKNGVQDGTEVFTGHKVYDETFTKVFSLKKNGTGSYDRDALNRLETAINANLDPKLHITIKDNGEVVMANGAKDPWNKEYHGYYISNAENDGNDRGAIVMYSDGANNSNGTTHSIIQGIVGLKNLNNNKDAKDDYAIATVYTFANGYGEVVSITYGFSNNQTFNPENSSAVDNLINNNLASQYILTYYDSLTDALNESNASNAGYAAFATYEKDGSKYIAFMENVTLSESYTIPTDVNIDLNGCTVTFVGNNGLIFNGNSVIDGATANSSVISNGVVIACNANSNVTLLSGTYTSHTDGTGTTSAPISAIVVDANASLNLSDTSVNIIDSANGTINGIRSNGVLNIENSSICLEAGECLDNIGIYSAGECVVRESTIIAKADYTANAAGTNYASNSRAILSDGATSSLELYDCNVWGAHSGVTARGDLVIEGGTYEGYGHGGLYVASYAGVEVHLRDATFTWAEMKEGTVADAIAGTNGAGMYIGGCSNVNVYVDNCEIYGTKFGVVLRGSGGEANNMLYISNSNVTGGNYACRMRDAWSSRIYIGAGNNFDSSSIDYPGNTISTTETYR